MKKLGLLCVLAVALGCGSDTSITVPENATTEAPDEEAVTEMGDGGESKGPGESYQLKPRT